MLEAVERQEVKVAASAAMRHANGAGAPKPAKVIGNALPMPAAQHPPARWPSFGSALSNRRAPRNDTRVLPLRLEMVWR